MQNGFNNVRSLYAHPDDVDLYTGILMEREMSGAVVGPTAACIMYHVSKWYAKWYAKWYHVCKI